MKRKITSIITLVVVFMFLLTGCMGNKDVTSDNAENKEISSDEGTDKTSDNDGDADESDVSSYYEYSDIVFNRSIVEEKFACYFIHSDASMNTYDGNTVCGDSTLLIAPDGTTMLIDCNMTSCASRLVAALQRLGITKLDYFVNSHPHGDHIGGWSTLLRYIEVGQVYITGSNLYKATGNRYVTGFLDALDEKKIPYETLYQGDTLEFGGAQIEILWPSIDTDWNTGDTTDLLQNENSIVMKVTYKDSSFLFGGDIGRTTEGILVDTYGEKIQADIAKMNHHGYTNTSESDKWLKAVRSKLSVAMFYSAHTEESMYRYVLNETTPLYTGLDKTCLIYTTGDGAYDVQVEKDRDFYDYLLPDMTDGHFKIK